jgi:uncharacterized protein involved in response to NO
MNKTFPIFLNSVRVFFPLAALIAVLVPMFTVTTIVNDYTPPPSLFSFFEWHGFQMLFCFFYTLIMGFILTAGAHWTNQKPISGAPLIVLLILWVNEQIAVSFSTNKTYLLVSSGLLAFIFISYVYDLLKNYHRKYVFLSVIGIYSFCKILYIYGATHRGFTYKDQIYDFTVWLLVLLTSIVAKNVIPTFTKNYFKLDNEPNVPRLLSSIFIVSLTLISLTPFIDSPLFSSIIFSLTALTGMSHLFYWHTIDSLKKPILGMLHIGFFILNFSLLTKGASFYFESLNLTRASLHLILTGGISILALNIMVRAILGNTGRKIEMTKSISVMYISIIIGMLIRFLVPIINIDLFNKSLHHSMGMWTLAFLIYFIRFLPVAFMKRADS